MKDYDQLQMSVWAFVWIRCLITLKIDLKQAETTFASNLDFGPKGAPGEKCKESASHHTPAAALL